MTQLKTDIERVAGQLGNSLSGAYPLYEQQKQVQILITPEGAQQQASEGALYQFRSVDGAWTVSITDSFISLETTDYTSADDFAERFSVVLSALSSAADIPLVSRIGFRYINRVDTPDVLDRLGDLVNPTVLGGAAVPLAGSAQFVHSLGQALYEVDGSSLQVKWANLPPGGTIDPSIEGSKERSWLLDLDAFRETRTPFEPANLASEARGLATVAYKFFRWATNEKFLTAFGGTP